MADGLRDEISNRLPGLRLPVAWIGRLKLVSQRKDDLPPERSQGQYSRPVAMGTMLRIRGPGAVTGPECADCRPLWRCECIFLRIIGSNLGLRIG